MSRACGDRPASEAPRQAPRLPLDPEPEPVLPAPGPPLPTSREPPPAATISLAALEARAEQLRQRHAGRGFTVLVGLCTLGGISALIRPVLIGELFGLGRGAMTAIGSALLLVVLSYLGLAAWLHRPIHIRNFELPVPPLRLALGQVAVGTTDFLLVSAVLHQMLSALIEIDFFPVAMGYVAANSAAILSHVPGGLGVIEAVVLSLVPGAQVIGALVAFRVVYYLIPFMIGGLLLGGCELLRRQRRIAAGPEPSR